MENYQSRVQSDTQGIKLESGVKSSYSNHFVAKKLKIIRFDFGKDNYFKKFRIWHSLIKNYEIFKEADVVHCHDVFFWYLPLRFLFPNKKVFITFHGYESFPLPKKNIFLHKLWEKLTDGNICVGKFIQKWYGTTPDYIIYGAVNKSNNPKIKSLKKSYSAYFVGRLDEQTNILQYMGAVKLIRKYIKRFNFVIAGDGKYRVRAEKVGRVLGFISKPEVNFKKYRYAFISRYLAILEAMQEKRLVFALYDNPIKKDYLKMTPFASSIVIVSSQAELADKVRYYLKHSREEKELIDKAYEWSQKQTWKNVTNTYLKLWNKA